MKHLVSFKRNYFLLTVGLFLTEVLIAVYLDDRFIRPYFGDFLVVILVYCFLRTCIHLPVIPLALFALLFAYLVETLQYLNILERFNLQQSKFARIVLGSSFEWTDMLAYTLGIAFVLFVEKKRGAL